MKSKLESLKLVVINFATLLIGLALMSGSVSVKNAQAARFETVPPVQILSLKAFRGQYLTVLYAVGSRPFISDTPTQLTISQIKDSRTVYINEDEMILPKVQVEKEGFRPSYNMIVVVVSPKANFSWVNGDGTIPQGSVATDNKKYSVINIVNKTDVENLITAQGAPGTFVVQLKR